MNTCALLKDDNQIKSVLSMKRIDDKGYMYLMDCDYDYYKLPSEVAKIIDAGCSTFYTKNLSDEYLLCRNYDYSHFKNNDRHNERTALNVIVKANNPSAKYRSIGVCDAFWLDYKNGSYIEGCIDDDKTDLSAFVLCPYLCMDGLNEKGILVSIMALSVDVSWEEIPFDSYKDRLEYGKEPLVLENSGEIPATDYIYGNEGSIAINKADQKAWVGHCDLWKTTMPNKKTVLPPILMRYILDNCASIEEAIGLADNFNIAAAAPGSAYHIMIADNKGNSRLLEWVDNKMNVIDINHATNYHVSKDDGFHGHCGRDECIKSALTRMKNGMREDYAESVLKLVSQDNTNGADRGKTLYSCIYNSNKLALKVYSFGDFKKSWDIDL